MWQYECPRNISKTDQFRRMFDFIWNFSTPKVKRTTLIQTTRNGSLNIPDMTIICKSLKVLRVKRLLNDDPKQWKVIPIHFLKSVGGRFLFKCNYDIKTLNVKIPPMYKRIIQVWSELNTKHSSDGKPNT